MKKSFLRLATLQLQLYLFDAQEKKEKEFISYFQGQKQWYVYDVKNHTDLIPQRKISKGRKTQQFKNKDIENMTKVI